MLAKKINSALFPLGIQIKKARKPKNPYPVEATPRDIEIINYVIKPENPLERITMRPIDVVWSVIQATKYIVKNDIPGDLVECGVWRGGMAIAMAMVLDDLKSDKKIYLYDTYEGMTKPSIYDVDYKGGNAENKFNRLNKDSHNEWCYASLDDVKNQFKKIGLEKHAIYIKGDVMETLTDKKNIPEKISLLRLNTDWYESTKKEMEVLFPVLEKDGVFLIDTYAHWKGARKAIDEYLDSEDLKDKSLAWKTDYDGRGFVKK